MLKKGFEVTAIAPEDDYSQRLKDLGCDYHPVEIVGTGANPIKDIKTFLLLRRIYKKVEPDIVLHYTIKPNIYGTLAARSLGIPCINNVSGLGTVFLDRSIASFIAKILYRVSFNMATLVFFQNRDDKEDFIFSTGLKKLQTDLLPGSGIDLQYFQPRQKNTTKNFTFLLVARLIVEKGIYEYVEAAKSLKTKHQNVEFQIIGSVDEDHSRGISQKEVDDWVDKDIINFLGTKDDPRQFIADADCIVLPSYREGTPKTLLEAAAMGRPIVTTDVPGCREVVNDGLNGFLCKGKNSNSLAEKLDEMISLNSEQREKFGTNGRKRVEETFDERLVINKYLTQISNIITLKARK